MNGKHCSLLQNRNNYGHKKFYDKHSSMKKLVNDACGINAPIFPEPVLPRYFISFVHQLLSKLTFNLFILIIS